VAILLFGVWYAFAARHFRIPWPRIAAFYAGLAMIAASLLSPIEWVALHSMLSFHLLQNVMLADWAPPLLVLGITASMAASAERVPGFPVLTRPAVALTVWLLVWYGVHIPAFYGYALHHYWALGVEHLLFLVAGIAFWWPVLVPGRTRPGPRLVYLAVAFFVAAPIALVIALSHRSLYPFYDSTPHLFGLSPLHDQQLGGILMAVEQSILLFVAASWTFFCLMDEEEDDEDAAREVAFHP
jgi:cytochrome c oxidase assembly factor CtaG